MNKRQCRRLMSLVAQSNPSAELVEDIKHFFKDEMWFYDSKKDVEGNRYDAQLDKHFDYLLNTNPRGGNNEWRY